MERQLVFAGDGNEEVPQVLENHMRVTSRVRDSVTHLSIVLT